MYERRITQLDMRERARGRKHVHIIIIIIIIIAEIKARMLTLLVVRAVIIILVNCAQCSDAGQICT